VKRVAITIEHVSPGDLSWAVIVDGDVVLSGLTRTEALKERTRLWWSHPRQRALARERITGGTYHADN
jgi:hypothetical protein